MQTLDEILPPGAEIDYAVDSAFQPDYYAERYAVETVRPGGSVDAAKVRVAFTEHMLGWVSTHSEELAAEHRIEGEEYRAMVDAWGRAHAENQRALAAEREIERRQRIEWRRQTGGDGASIGDFNYLLKQPVRRPRSRRSRGATPRRRGSRRSTGTGSRAGPEDGESDPPGVDDAPPAGGDEDAEQPPEAGQ